MKSIKTKIIISLLAVLIVISSGLSIGNYIKASNSMQDLAAFMLKNNLQHNISIASTYLEKYYGDIAFKNGVLVDQNGKGIAGDMQMVDALSADAGGVATIFAKSGDDFIRVSTNVLNDKGERAIGTRLGKDSLAYTDVSQGKNYLGQANILNKSYLTAYNPLFDQNGQVIGLLFVGISQSESAGQIQTYLNQIRNSSLLVIIIALLLSLLLAYYIGNSISKPIISTASDMQRIASGDLSFQLDNQFITRTDEIGTLARSLGEIVQSIKGLTDQTRALAESTVSGRLDARIDVTQHQGEYRRVVEGMNVTLDAVVGPLNVAAAYVERISKGDIPEKITDSYNGNFNEIKNNLNACIDGLGGLVECCAVIKRLALNDYTHRVEGKYLGIFADTAAGVNTIRDRLIRAVEVNAHIGAGNLVEDLENYKRIGKRCEEDQLIPTRIMCAESILRLVSDARMLAEAAVAGKLDIRADVTQHQGEYRRVVEGMNATLDAVVGPLNVAAEYIERIGKGDIPPKITETYNGDFNEIKNSLNNCIDGLDGLVESCDVLKRMAVNDYTTTVNGQYQGIFADTAQATNAVRTMLLYIDNTVNEIANGDFSDLEDYRQMGKRSEEDKLVPAIIVMMENILQLVGDANMMAEAAVNGRLEVRIDAARHQGEFRGVIEGINKTLDAVIGPLNMAAEYIDRIAKGDTPPKITDNYNGDFNEIKNNLNHCIDEITTLVEEVGVVITAGAEGKLDQRANADRGQGVYRKILKGVNATLDSVIEPINEATKVMDELAQGRLNVNVTGNYKGDHARIKDALNTTISFLQGVIGEVAQVLKQVADGNLDVNIAKDYDGDFVAISTAINNIINSLNEVMGDINQASEQVAGGSGQVSDSSQALAQGANEQASAIEQLTAAITEIAAQTKQNATNANQANELALNARDNAVQGNKQMKEMLAAMEGINDSSANISKIIKVIDEIAFQTNILALNAAVEAARAGQHGKGFAVVAEEVRNLAARSASAAKETTDLIEGSIRKVQSGTKIANDTAQALDKIVDGVSHAAVLVGDIAVASNEQATGIAQVDQGIVQVSQVVQNNSATAQQSAAASEELSEQARLLKGNVARFRLKASYTNSQSSSFQAAAQNRSQKASQFISPGMTEAAATSSVRPKIALDDSGFGKY